MSEALKNEIHAYFSVQNTTTTAPVRQWAYGQKLIIHDPNLPNVFEAYYSNSKSIGDAKPQIGQDGEVRAPHEYFESGADIYVFLMQHEGEEDGRYNKVVHIPITPAPKPVDIDPNPEEKMVIGELVDAMNTAVAQCETYVEHYPIVINGYWYVWDEETEQFISTGVAATGNGIADARLNNNYTLTLVFTDGSSFTTPISIRGATGDSGVYIGESAPTDPDKSVWIDTNGESDVLVSDVRIDGTSIVNNGVANIPLSLDPVTVSGSTPSITARAGERYVCGEVSAVAIVTPATGIIDVVFKSGTTPTVLTITPPTGMTMKWANDFDPTTLEADTVYEINIMDGIYGVVMAWT